MTGSLSTRRAFLCGALAGGAACAFGGPSLVLPRKAVPSASQLAWQEQELGMFFHLDISIWKPGWNWRSWRDYPNPDVYNPAKLDTDQWVEAAKAMGAKYVVFVAKHCTGFLQWQSGLYDYGVRQSAWRGGKGDVVRDFVDSARRYGLKPGIYASVSCNGFLNADNPGRVNRGRGGDPEAQARYVKICEQMCTELWSRYGDLFEIWFDGGALPPSQGGPDLVPIIEKYQPNAVLFQGPNRAKNLLRWCGNERGVAHYPCWGSTNHLSAEGGDREKSFPGDPAGQYWAPAECDVPLRRGNWFWTDETQPHSWRYWTTEELVDMYVRSVGRNSNLLLNANPNTDGLVPEQDFDCYRKFGAALKARYAHPLGSVSGEGDSLTLFFKEPVEVNEIVVMEDIRMGHRILDYQIDGALAEGGVKRLCWGKSIGHKRIESCKATAVTALTLRVHRAVDMPQFAFTAYRV